MTDLTTPQAWTPEPWQITETGVVLDQEGLHVATCANREFYGEYRAHVENAYRIVRAVNGCAALRPDIEPGEALAQIREALLHTVANCPQCLHSEECSNCAEARAALSLFREEVKP